MRSNRDLLSLAALVTIAGCSVKEAPKEADSGTAATTASAPAAPNVVNITATEYKFDAPESIPAGLTTFRMTDAGAELHHASLIKLDSGKTLADFQAGMKAMKPGTPPPGWVIPAGGPNAVTPGSTSELTVVLEPGNYVMVCFIPDAKGVPHVMSGMMKGLTVTPNPNANMTEPAADVIVTLRDYKFDFSTPLTAGKHTLKIETAPGQPHEFTLFQLAAGKTLADLMKYLEIGMKGEPPGMPIGGVAGVAAGKPSFFAVDLKPGDYALVCFLEDARDGKPHFAHGMAQQLKVS